MGSHGNHVISHMQMDLLLGEHNLLLKGGFNKTFDINKKYLWLKVGLLLYVVLVFPMVLSSFLSFH